MIGKVLGAVGCVLGVTGLGVAGSSLSASHKETNITPIESQINDIKKVIKEISDKVDLLDVDSDYTNKDIALIAKELRERLLKLETRRQSKTIQNKKG